MRDELITKWKNSLVLNDEKELFEDSESKARAEEMTEVNEDESAGEFVELPAKEPADESEDLKMEETTGDTDELIILEPVESPATEEVENLEEEMVEVFPKIDFEDIKEEIKDEIEILEPVEGNGLDVEKELLRMERKKFEIEKSLAYERIQLEIETLKQEREKFDRMRRLYDKQRRLDEESFQEAKLEFEKYKELEMQKLQLETKEMLNNCHNFKEFFDNYNNDRK